MRNSLEWLVKSVSYLSVICQRERNKAASKRVYKKGRGTRKARNEILLIII